MESPGGCEAKEDERGKSFATFFAAAEPPLRRALIARYGRDRGLDATAEALTWAWQHWDDFAGVRSPVGYLYRVGQSKSRRRRTRPLFERPASDDQMFEPALEGALARLPERQRVALMLVYGAEWTHAEVAELLGLHVATVQKHVERGRARLRRLLEVGDET